MIEFKGVSLSFGERRVLRDVSFRIRLFERVAILGGSGEGKTTILRLILGLTRPDEGSIIISGTDITGLAESRLREYRIKFSIVFQEGALFDSLSVRENVAFNLRESGLAEDEIEARVRELLQRVGIEDAIDLMPEELSGGMMKRAAIARSLSTDPKMFLYDEPTTGLDPLTSEKICDLIDELSSGPSSGRKGFIVVTHKVADAMRVADRFLYLHNGRIGFDGSGDELRATTDPELREFISELFLAGGAP